MFIGERDKVDRWVGLVPSKGGNWKRFQSDDNYSRELRTRISTPQKENYLY